MTDIVLVTKSEYCKGEDVFSAAQGVQLEPVAARETTLAAAVRARRCRGVIVGVHPYRRELYEALASVAGDGPGLIARFGVGHDSIDKQQARRSRNLGDEHPGSPGSKRGGAHDLADGRPGAESVLFGCSVSGGDVFGGDRFGTAGKTAGGRGMRGDRPAGGGHRPFRPGDAGARNRPPIGGAIGGGSGHAVFGDAGPVGTGRLHDGRRTSVS